MKFSKCLATVVLSLAALGSQAANLVSNGSFEAESINNGSWQIYNNLTGWSGAPNIELRNNIAGAAQDGFNYVELATDRTSSMSQIINATGWVDLSFWFSARPKTGAVNDIGVEFGDLSDVFLQGVSNSTNTHDWQQFTSRVNLGDSGSAVLRFFAAGSNQTYGASLDNITVTAVPEPATSLMFLTGLGMVAVIISYFAQKGVALFFHVQIGPTDAFDLELALQSHPLISLIYVIIEELTKFFAAYVVVFHTKWFREPIDAFIYLMTAALGFAAMENTLFYMILPMMSGTPIQEIIITGHTRFIGSSVLHVASSGMLAVFIGLSFCKSPLVREFRIWLGILIAVLILIVILL